MNNKYSSDRNMKVTILSKKLKKIYWMTFITIYINIWYNIIQFGVASRALKITYILLTFWPSITNSKIPFAVINLYPMKNSNTMKYFIENIFCKILLGVVTKIILLFSYNF